MNNNKFTRYAFVFLAVFVVTIVVKAAGPRLFYPALVKSDYVPEAGFSADMTYNFSKDGCYSIGLVGKSDELKFYFTEGKEKIEFLDANGALIDEVFIKKNRLSSVHRSLKLLDMYVFEIPYKKKYRNLTIRYSIEEPDPVLRALKEKLTLYVNPCMFSCGEAYQEELLAKERKLNLKEYGIKEYEETEPTYVDLFNALKKRDLESVKQVLQTKKMALHVKLSGDREPIHYAAYFNDAQTLTYLIEQGVDLNPTDINGFTPIQYAIGNNAVEAVLLLLDGGVDINSVKKVPNILNGFKAEYRLSDLVFYAVDICSCELVDIYADYNIDLNRYKNSMSNNRMSLLEYLTWRRCRYDFDSEITPEIQKKYESMRQLLISYGVEEKPVKFSPVHIGKRK